MISIIAAMGENQELGLANRLLWKLPVDMKYFRQTTMGKPILVGRKTYESFGGKPLPGRKNIVISKDEKYLSEGAVVVHSIEDALQQAGTGGEIMIIGGASFYKQMLPQVDRLYLTFVNASFEADTWFPKVAFSEWRETSREHHCADEKNPFDCSFVVYDRH